MEHWLSAATLPEDRFWDLRGDGAEERRLRESYTAELRRELAPDHVLATADWTLVATAHGSDDVVLLLHDGRAAVVHLTWTRTPPERPPYPRTTIVDGYDELTGLAG